MLDWMDHPFEGNGVELKNILRWEDEGERKKEINRSLVILSSN